MGRTLNRVPVVRGIYSTLKSMMDILSFAERDSYRRVVLIQFPKNGHYCFAFVTGVSQGWHGRSIGSAGAR